MKFALQRISFRTLHLQFKVKNIKVSWKTFIIGYVMKLVVFSATTGSYFSRTNEMELDKESGKF